MVNNQAHPVSPRGLINRHAIAAIVGQTIRSGLLSPGLYLVLGIAMFLTLFVVRNTIQAIQTDSMAVIRELFFLPTLGAVLLVGVFVGLITGIGIAHERGAGLVETLFYGPVSWTDYILGKASAQVLLAIAALMFYALLVAGLATLLNMALSPALLGTLLLGVVTTAYIVAVGVFSASLVRSTRAAILLFSAIILLCFAIEFGSSLLVSLASANEQTGLFLLRDTLSALNQLAAWFSPVTLLVDGSMSALRSDWITWGRTVGLTLVWAAATIGFSVFSFERRGNVR